MFVAIIMVTMMTAAGPRTQNYQADHKFKTLAECQDVLEQGKKQFSVQMKMLHKDVPFQVDGKCEAEGTDT